MLKIETIAAQNKKSNGTGYKEAAKNAPLKDCVDLLVFELVKTLQNPDEVKSMLVGLALMANQAPNFTRMLTDQEAVNKLRNSFKPNSLSDMAKMLPFVLGLSKRYNLDADLID